jgi:hypothetical protein
MTNTRQSPASARVTQYDVDPGHLHVGRLSGHVGASDQRPGIVAPAVLRNFKGKRLYRAGEVPIPRHSHEHVGLDALYLF